MHWGGIIVADLKISTPFLELCSVKLLLVVSDDGMGYPKSTYDGSPKEVCHVFCGNAESASAFIHLMK
jgi:hypothetical protein